MKKKHIIVGTSSTSYLTKCGLHIWKWRLRGCVLKYMEPCKRCARLEAIEKARNNG